MLGWRRRTRMKRIDKFYLLRTFRPRSDRALYLKMEIPLFQSQVRYLKAPLEVPHHVSTASSFPMSFHHSPDKFLLLSSWNEGLTPPARRHLIISPLNSIVSHHSIKTDTISIQHRRAFIFLSLPIVRVLVAKVIAR